jgi:hypothetical protein
MPNTVVLVKESHTKVGIKILTLISVANFVDRVDASAHPSPSVLSVQGEGLTKIVDPTVSNLRSVAVFLDNNNAII